ncbi:hypothetical protein VTL71DRAFT_358 [Oculimacula yallundae]|uniref:DUF1996 domain-containing protein n=1 Tax=Oculimacula yallundae TaxID=86028 RepID=A0ABR4CZS4_9HELO
MMWSSLTPFLLMINVLVPAVLGTDVWTTNCGVLSIQRSDPIVSPGGPSSHVHAISGGTAFTRNMAGIDDAVNAKATTCDKFTDHSNYWCPQLYHIRDDGMFDLVPFMGTNVYYKRYTCDYQEEGLWCPRPTGARPFPPGLRMVAGDPFRRTQNDLEQSHQAVLYETEGSTEVYGFPKVVQGRLQLNVRFPSCWDGVNLDSPDHKSHMSYPSPLRGDTQGGICPQSHPIALLHIGAEFGFLLSSLNITSSSSLVFSNGDTTGFGGHADFLQGWTNLTALGESFDNCDGFGADCKWNSFGTPDGREGVKRDLSPEVELVGSEWEEVGLNGPLVKLPGNNKVWSATSATSSMTLGGGVTSKGLESVVASATSMTDTETILSSTLSLSTELTSTEMAITSTQDQTTSDIPTTPETVSISSNSIWSPSTALASTTDANDIPSSTSSPTSSSDTELSTGITSTPFQPPSPSSIPISTTTTLLLSTSTSASSNTSTSSSTSTTKPASLPTLPFQPQPPQPPRGTRRRPRPFDTAFQTLAGQ